MKPLVTCLVPKCAKTSSYFEGAVLPVVTYAVGPARFAPVVSLEVPLLQMLRRGRVLVQQRRSAPLERDPGTAALHPLRADPVGQVWSCATESEYLVLVLDVDVCRTLLHREPGWEATGRPPIRSFDPRLTWWMREMEAQILQDHPLGNLYTESCQLALISYLDAVATGQPQPRRDEKLLAPGLQKVQAYVLDNLDSKLRIQDLAQICDCSPAHLSRLFRNSIGMPVHRYVTDQRIQKAQHLLSTGKSDLAEIAVVCGFATQAHFGNQFRRYVGMTPRQYREAK